MLPAQVLVAAGDSVWVVDADAAVEQGLTAGPVLRLAASPDGRFVAGFSAAGIGYRCINFVIVLCHASLALQAHS